MCACVDKGKLNKDYKDIKECTNNRSKEQKNERIWKWVTRIEQKKIAVDHKGMRKTKVLNKATMKNVKTELNEELWFLHPFCIKAYFMSHLKSIPDTRWLLIFL